MSKNFNFIFLLGELAQVKLEVITFIHFLPHLSLSPQFIELLLIHLIYYKISFHLCFLFMLPAVFNSLFLFKLLIRIYPRVPKSYVLNCLLTYFVAQQPLKSFERPLMRGLMMMMVMISMYLSTFIH